MHHRRRKRETLCRQNTHVFGSECINVDRNPSGVKGCCSASSSSRVWQTPPWHYPGLCYGTGAAAPETPGTARDGPMFWSVFKKGLQHYTWYCLGFHLHSSLFAKNCRIIPEIHLKFMVYLHIGKLAHETMWGNMYKPIFLCCFLLLFCWLVKVISVYDLKHSGQAYMHTMLL